MENQVKERRISIPYSFPTSFHDELQEDADARTKSNRSTMTEYWIRKGKQAEAEENGAEPESQAAKA